MKRLILTSSDSAVGVLKRAGFADGVIPFGVRFVCGPLLSTTELETLLSARSVRQGASAPHWLDSLAGTHPESARAHGLGLAEFCERFDAVELWIDPEPNSQLQLIWLLDHLRRHSNIISRLALVQMDTAIGNHLPSELVGLERRAIPIRNDHLEIASTAWAAYRAPTPAVWFDLLEHNLSVLPRLQGTVVTLLEELPNRGSGLGATEMRMLELISAGHVHPHDLFPGHEKPNERRTFVYWEIGALLDGLARCPSPAVSGLDEGPFTIEMHEQADRHARYKQSRLSLTELGKAVLAQADDFTRHNPIHRWWGGTELTNDRLWRWDSLNRALVAP
ncbi:MULTISPECIES: hypothetical protein [Bradyrhizobium]|uniref:hypothetical protein n=1 Tax=Bradyrhizobium elkanii TaxID=29448 RepID=UPI000422A5D0|nr:hypothetical protein [Bradyrhizobium elkanii]